MSPLRHSSQVPAREQLKTVLHTTLQALDCNKFTLLCKLIPAKLARIQESKGPCSDARLEPQRINNKSQAE